MRARSLQVLMVALVTAAGRPTLAEDDPPLPPEAALTKAEPRGAGFSRRWQYPSFDGWDGAVTASAAGVALISAFLPPPREPRWEGGILFDDALRNSLRAESRAGRDRARLVGDIFYFGGVLAPTLIDNLVVALGVRRAPGIAAQMLLIDLEAYAVAGALLIGSERVFARARPSVRPCERDGNYEAYCGDSDASASLISGHTGVVATSAGLLCAHHQFLHLYGDGGADALACAVGIGAALTTGVARLINDRHYATDILAAFGVGALSGYALPVLRYYHSPEYGESASTHWLIAPDVTRTSAGVRLLYAL